MTERVYGESCLAGVGNPILGGLTCGVLDARYYSACELCASSRAFLPSRNIKSRLLCIPLLIV
jgi:hypothetical protein